MSIRGESSQPVLFLDEVTRLFGRHPALVKASMQVRAGEVVALIGPNGAGKSTLLRVAATALRPTFGRGAVLGLDLERERRTVRRHVAFLSHQSKLYEDLTCAENLRFWATLTQAPPDHVDGSLEAVGLLRESGSRVHDLSNGQRQRLALARVMLRRPALLLLDEPYAALDEDGRLLVDGLLAEVRSEGRSALVVSHDLARTIAAADRVMTLGEGRIVSDVPASDVRAKQETGEAL